MHKPEETVEKMLVAFQFCRKTTLNILKEVNYYWEYTKHGCNYTHSTGFTHCMGPQPLRFMIAIRKQLITLSNKTFYTSGKNEKGQEGTPEGCWSATCVHLLRHCWTHQVDIMGKATSLQLYVLGPFFPSLCFDLAIIPLKEVEALFHASTRPEYFAS